MPRPIAIVCAYVAAVHVALVTWFCAGQLWQSLLDAGSGWPDTTAAEARILAFLTGAEQIGVTLFGAAVALPVAGPLLILCERRPRMSLAVLGALGVLAAPATYAIALFGLSGGAEYRRMLWEFGQGRYANYSGQFIAAALAGLVAGLVYGLMRRALAAALASRPVTGTATARPGTDATADRRGPD